MRQDKRLTTELGISSYIRGIALGSYSYHRTAGLGQLEPAAVHGHLTTTT
jgi:hypothetical protein